jgi:hypothetical protein
MSRPTDDELNRPVCFRRPLTIVIDIPGVSPDGPAAYPSPTTAEISIETQAVRVRAIHFRAIRSPELLILLIIVTVQAALRFHPF